MLCNLLSPSLRVECKFHPNRDFSGLSLTSPKTDAVPSTQTELSTYVGIFLQLFQGATFSSVVLQAVETVGISWSLDCSHIGCSGTHSSILALRLPGFSHGYSSPDGPVLQGSDSWRFNLGFIPSAFQ